MILGAQLVVRPVQCVFGLLCMALLLGSCVQPGPVFVGWDPAAAGVAARTESDAILEWPELPGLVATIDGKTADGRCVKAELPPGRHVITYAYHTAGFGQHPQGSIELEMKAAHAYRLRVKLCFWCSPRRYAVWVDDRTTGELVWGKRPDWPSWYL